MKKIFLFSVLVFFILWLMGLIVFDYKINHIPVDTTTKTDAIVVLTGGRHRLEEAIKFLNAGVSDRLFISGVEKNISLEDLEKNNDIKIKEKDRIFLDKVATNTFENARETSFWIKEQNIKSIRLVTSNYHIFRSLVEFRRLNTETEILLSPVFSEKIASSWWRSFYSFYFLACEYNKFLFAWGRALVYRV